MDEAAINLDLVDLEIAQMVQAGIARPKIVERDPHPRRAQRAEHRLRIVHVGDNCTFGDLDLEPMRCEACLR